MSSHLDFENGESLNAAVMGSLDWSETRVNPGAILCRCQELQIALNPFVRAMVSNEESPETQKTAEIQRALHKSNT
jgi:hypothetical protein